jgi:hypothetical protein
VVRPGNIGGDGEIEMVRNTNVIDNHSGTRNKGQRDKMDNMISEQQQEIGTASQE